MLVLDLTKNSHIKPYPTNQSKGGLNLGIYDNYAHEGKCKMGIIGKQKELSKELFGEMVYKV